MIKSGFPEKFITKKLPDDWIPHPNPRMRTPETQAKWERIEKERIEKERREGKNSTATPEVVKNDTEAPPLMTYEKYKLPTWDHYERPPITESYYELPL